MKIRIHLSLFAVLILIQATCQVGPVKRVTVPFILDHNRMLVEAEIQRNDGTWRKTLLWVDTGNPDFLISESFARDLGIETNTAKSEQGISLPNKVRIGDFLLDFTNTKVVVGAGIQWLFNTMHNDGNLPSTVLKNLHVIFDYPNQELTLALPGVLKPHGIRSPAIINPANGIIQMDAVIDGEKYSLALDNGASFSFVPEEMVMKLSSRHPDWPVSKGAVGYANIWGWWPEEESWPLLRIPELQWGTLHVRDAIIGGIPPFFAGGNDIAIRYSRKTVNPVNGFLGPNVFKGYRVEIDFQNNTVYFDQGAESDSHDMDIVGLTIRPLNDGKYQVVGTVRRNDKKAIEGIEAGDILLQVGELKTTGVTMGKVVDALRGKPGDLRVLMIEREGTQFTIQARVERFL